MAKHRTTEEELEARRLVARTLEEETTRRAGCEDWVEAEEAAYDDIVQPHTWTEPQGSDIYRQGYFF